MALSHSQINFMYFYQITEFVHAVAFALSIFLRKLGDKNMIVQDFSGGQKNAILYIFGPFEPYLAT